MVTESKTTAKVFIASPVRTHLFHPGYATRDIDMTITSVCPSVSDTLVCPVSKSRCDRTFCSGITYVRVAYVYRTYMVGQLK